MADEPLNEIEQLVESLLEKRKRIKPKDIDVEIPDELASVPKKFKRMKKRPRSLRKLRGKSEEEPLPRRVSRRFSPRRTAGLGTGRVPARGKPTSPEDLLSRYGTLPLHFEDLSVGDRVVYIGSDPVFQGRVGRVVWIGEDQFGHGHHVVFNDSMKYSQIITDPRNLDKFDEQ